MGKTAKGAVWLDPNKTAPYDFFQYWRNIDDKDVEKVFRFLTFLSLEEIEELTRYNDERMNKAKERLAYELTALVHGKDEADSAMAKARAAEVGKENIINATTGAFLDANGQLITMKTVEEVVKTIPFRDSAEYAPIEGTKGFVNAAIDGAFREYRPNGFIDGVATPGGTGGLHHSIYNYLEPGDTVLTMDRYWAAYKSICRECGRGFDTFVSFDENNKFNVQGCIDKLREYAEKQTNVFLVMNTPANNPTGYNVKRDEWEAIMAELTAIANNGKNNVVLLTGIL